MTNAFRPTSIRTTAWNSLREKWGMSALTYLIYLACVSAVSSVLVYIPTFMAAMTSLSDFGGNHGPFSIIDHMAQLSRTPIYNLGTLLSLAIIVPLCIGTRFVWLDVARGGQVEIQTLFEAFRKYFRYLGGYLLVCIFIFLWSLLFIIPGIIKGISYSMTFLIMRDNPAMPANDARRLSMDMMAGHKWEYFCLMLSFLGWIVLGVLTCGIGLLWVYPYILTAHAEFYRRLKYEREMARV